MVQVHRSVPKRKKGAGPRRSVTDAHEDLSHQALHGFLDGSAVWIVTNTTTSSMLDDCCIGTSCSISAMAEHVRAALQGTAGIVAMDEDEQLHLLRFSLEEAFFLMYALEVLSVHQDAGSSHSSCLSLEAFWMTSCQLRATFRQSYIAYHHYRCKGWVVRSGLLYGTDFVLYAGHPSAFHADYCVLLMPNDKPLLWIDLQICNRLCNQVGKQLILFYICHPEGANMSSMDMTSMDILENVEVEERLVSRWIPEKEITRLKAV